MTQKIDDKLLRRLADGREYRAMQLTADDGEQMRVEGFAATFGQPYTLYEDAYFRFDEIVDARAFDDTDLSDVILQYDHAGRVFARNTNGTLIVEADDNGLFIAADLDKTELARGLYEDIQAGMITKMSWCFRVGKYYVEREEGSKDRTIVHTEIPKIYDVSAVSIPANDNTEIGARDFVHGVMDEIARREAEAEERRRKLKLKIQLEV